MDAPGSSLRDGCSCSKWLFPQTFPNPQSLDTSSIRRKIPPNVQASRPQKIVAPTLLRDDCLYFSEN